MSERSYLVHYTKDGSYINIHVRAENEDEACDKADDKFSTKYNREAIEGYKFDYVEPFPEDTNV